MHRPFNYSSDHSELNVYSSLEELRLYFKIQVDSQMPYYFVSTHINKVLHFGYHLKITILDTLFTNWR